MMYDDTRARLSAGSAQSETQTGPEGERPTTQQIQCILPNGRVVQDTGNPQPESCPSDLPVGIGMSVRRNATKAGCASKEDSAVPSTSKKRQRGFYAALSVCAHTDKHGPRSMKWNAPRNRPYCPTDPKFKIQKMTRVIGMIVRQRMSMKSTRYMDISDDERHMLYDLLSTHFNIDGAVNGFLAWIDKKASGAYVEHKSKCHKSFQTTGADAIPPEFLGREDGWRHLCEHFKSIDFQKKSESMKIARKSEAKFDHHSGCVPFLEVAENIREAGSSKTPVLEMYDRVYTPKDDSMENKRRDETLAKVRDAKDLSKTIPEPEFDDSSTPTPMIPFEEEIEVLEKQVGRRGGTYVRGLGHQFVLEPRVRGPNQPRASDPQSSASTEELEQRLAERLEARLASERAAWEAEREAMEADVQRRVSEAVASQVSSQLAVIFSNFSIPNHQSPPPPK